MQTAEASSPVEPTAAELFAAGNYVRTAQVGDPAAWQTGAALGLIGATGRARAILDGVDEPEARFYLAAAHWIAGDEDAAARLLERSEIEHARNLLRLIRKPRIEVLAQLPSGQGGPHLLLDGGRRDPKFRIANVSYMPGYHPDDRLNRPYADVHRFYDRIRPPDFYLCQMIEWHMMPPNIRDLACPLIGHTSDFDVDIQAIHDWMKVFDYLVVSDHWEHVALRPLTRRPLFAFPKAFAVPMDIPEQGAVERDIDVLMTGSMVHPYHPDRMELVARVGGLEGVRSFIVNGFAGAKAYYDLMGRAKIYPSQYRRAGGSLTRCMEALALGTVAIVDGDYVLHPYIGDYGGIVSYDGSADGLTRAIHAILADYPRHRAAAERGGAVVRREFAAGRAGSQYLRFATVLAARPRHARGPQPVLELDQRRRVLGKGWVPPSAKATQAILQANVRHYTTRLQRGANAWVLNSLGRELALHVPLMKDNDGGRAVEAGTASAIDCLQRAVRAEPRSLVAHFNLLRAAMHHGSQAEMQTTIAATRDVLAQPTEQWQVHPLDTMLPYDFHPQYFNARDYTDAVVAVLSGDRRRKADLVRLLLASMHYYVGLFGNDSAAVARAAELDPAFPYYGLEWAKRLIDCGGDGDIERAAGILARLAGRTVVGIEAFLLLDWLVHSRGVAVPEFDRIAAAVRRLERRSISLEQVGGNRPALHRLKVLRRGPAVSNPKLSVVVVGRDGVGATRALADLPKLKAQAAGIEALYVDLFDPPAGVAGDHCDLAIAVQQREFFYNTQLALNVGLLHAAAPVVAFGSDDAAVPDLLAADIAARFDGTADPVFFQRSYDIGGRPSTWYAFRTLDAIRAGGFDEGGPFIFDRGGPGELARRLGAGGFIGGDAAASPAGDDDGLAALAQPVFRAIWPFHGLAGDTVPLVECPDIARLRKHLIVEGIDAIDGRPAGFLRDVIGRQSNTVAK